LLWTVIVVNCYCYERLLSWIVIAMNGYCCELLLLWTVIVMNCYCYERLLLWIVIAMNGYCRELLLLRTVIVVNCYCYKRLLLWAVAVVVNGYCYEWLLLFTWLLLWTITAVELCQINDSLQEAIVILLYKAKLIIISLKINLFSQWYSWKIAELEINNNHLLTIKQQQTNKHKATYILTWTGHYQQKCQHNSFIANVHCYPCMK
jgi:hypothetical protein